MKIFLALSLLLSATPPMSSGSETLAAQTLSVQPDTIDLGNIRRGPNSVLRVRGLSVPTKEWVGRRGMPSSTILLDKSVYLRRGTVSMYEVFLKGCREHLYFADSVEVTNQCQEKVGEQTCLLAPDGREYAIALNFIRERACDSDWVRAFDVIENSASTCADLSLKKHSRIEVPVEGLRASTEYRAISMDHGTCQFERQTEMDGEIVLRELVRVTMPATDQDRGNPLRESPADPSPRSQRDAGVR